MVLVFLAAVSVAAGALPRFAEVPEYRNGERCPSPAEGLCDAGLVHIAMTLDAHYLRGSMAAVYSLLKHASCPEIYPELLRRAVSTSFPSLRFEIYPFRADAVAGLISASVRAALEAPLNYARNHLADLLPRCVPRAIYLDSDVLGGSGRRACPPPPSWPRPSTATPTSPGTSRRRSGPTWSSARGSS
jgi:hypothetical protein